MIITIGIKAHLAKFLIQEESLNTSNGSIILTKNRIIPNFIISKLVYKKKFFEEKVCEKVINVKFLLGDHFVKRGTIYINDEGILYINSFLAKLFHWKLEMYIGMNPKLTRKAATIQFLEMYNIEPDIDVAMCAIKKTNDRYRRDYPDVFPKPLTKKQ